MNLEAFLRDGGPRWDQLEGELVRARGRPERLGAAGVRSLATLYREASADLALARRRFRGEPVVGRLEALEIRARPLIYASEPRRGEPLLTFFARGYWQRVLENPSTLALAWVLLLAPALLATVWALKDPQSALGVVPGAFRRAGEAHGAAPESAADRAAFASAIFSNNIKVSFLAFAAGIAAGLGTAFVLVSNGVLLGAVAGLSFGASNGTSFVELVAPHGLLELSCIAVTSAAGLRLGWALIRPGPGPRGPAVAAAARRAVVVVLGTIPWLVIAGLVEGFVTPTRLGVPGALVLGTTLAAAYWGCVLWRGHSRARAFALR